MFLVLVGLGYKIEDFTDRNKLPDNYWCVFSKHSCPMLPNHSIKNTLFRGANFGAYTDPSFESGFYNFYSRKCNWKCRLPKWPPFCPGGDELMGLLYILKQLTSNEWCFTTQNNIKWRWKCTWNLNGQRVLYDIWQAPEMSLPRIPRTNGTRGPGMQVYLTKMNQHENMF